MDIFRLVNNTFYSTFAIVKPLGHFQFVPSFGGIVKNRDRCKGSGWYQGVNCKITIGAVRPQLGKQASVCPNVAGGSGRGGEGVL